MPYSCHWRNIFPVGDNDSISAGQEMIWWDLENRSDGTRAELGRGKDNEGCPWVRNELTSQQHMNGNICAENWWNGWGGSILEDKLTLKKYLFSHKCKNTASTTSVCFPGLLDKSTFMQQVCSDSSSNLTDAALGAVEPTVLCCHWLKYKVLNSCVKRISP